jgi:hypothetical protein
LRQRGVLDAFALGENVRGAACELPSSIGQARAAGMCG